MASGDGGGGTLTKKVTISVKKESRGIPYILITQNMWRELGMGNGIYRVELSNDENHEFYVYNPGEGKVKLTQKDLKPEKQYTLTLTKIDLPKVIDEINNRIQRKYGNIQFRLMDNKDLYMVLPSGRKLKINEYELEKPFGGELRLLIKLKRNPYSNVIL